MSEHDMDAEHGEETLLAELTGRAKELACLYQIEEVLGDADRPLDEVFTAVIDVIPLGLQNPEACQARIMYGSKSYAATGFVESPISMAADIFAGDQRVGSVSLHYTPAIEDDEDDDEDPFQPHERKLVQTIAERLGHYMLHQQLKRMFDARNGEIVPAGESARREWEVALDLLRLTNPKLYGRISRKMMNYLCWRGVGEAGALLQLAGDEVAADGEANRPQRKASSKGLRKLTRETFKLAAEHLSDEEIKACVERWISEDKSSALVKPLLNVRASLAEISDAIRHFRQAKPEGIELTGSAVDGIRVALLRRFVSENLDFIHRAKKFVDIEDFFDLTDKLISPMGHFGGLGGKAAGLFVASQVLKQLRPKVPGLGKVLAPKTWCITSDGLLAFVQFNNLEEVFEQKHRSVEEVRQEYQHIVHLFKSCYFPREIVNGLSRALDDFGDVPIVVRSSSLLEDQLGAAFSGKYKSLFVANQGDKPERLEALLDAVAEVYASTFGPDPIEYRSERGLLEFNEEMGILIQEVVGQRVGRYWCPAFAGVAFSHNEFRWSPRIRRDDGLIRLVPGLGTRAVDRLADDYPILIAPSQPSLRVNATVDEAIRYSPRSIDVIDLEENRFVTRSFDELIAEVGADFPAIEQIVSVYRQGMLQRANRITTEFGKDDLVVTFEALITETSFVSQLGVILKTLSEAIGAPIDVEFASDGKDFYLLQCRPQSSSEGDVAAEIPKDVPEEDILFSANRYISNGRVPDLTHLVYVDPDRYGAISSHSELVAVGEAVGKLNQVLPKRQFILMGPGRWGSRGDIQLGVRVTYSDINNTAVLIEVARRKGGYVPDLSFGTHFFQDLVEASIRYLPLYPDTDGVHFNEDVLLGAPNLLASVLPDYAFLEDVIRVIAVRRIRPGRVLRLVMNADEHRALAYFADPETETHYSAPVREVSPQPVEDHWRWRLHMAERIAGSMDPERFGVVAVYVFGSTKNATAGPGSDIDLLVHFRGDPDQRAALETWLDGWSLSLDEMNYLRTGYRAGGLLDAQIITDEHIQRGDSYATKIGAVTDAARPLALGVPAP